MIKRARRHGQKRDTSKMRFAVPVVKDDSVQFPPRPPKGPVDIDALRKEISARYPKIRAELAK